MTHNLAICPHCLQKYTIGKTGTVTGCDTCEEIIRNADGMIIPSEWDAVMSVEDVDELTDMEKA
jgi:hypothetical protein